MSLDYRTENLFVPTPRSARFLRRTIPASRAAYVPLAAETRAAAHQPGTCGPDAWPIRNTKCGQDPGVWGDNPAYNPAPVRILQVAR